MVPGKVSGKALAAIVGSIIVVLIPIIILIIK